MSGTISQESSHLTLDAFDISIQRQIDRSIGDIIERIVSERIETSMLTKVDQLLGQRIDAAITAHAKHGLETGNIN
jgi:hypothetical protein